MSTRLERQGSRIFLRMDGSTLSLVAPLPKGTHNAQLLGEGAIYNDTANDRVCYAHGNHMTAIAVP